MESLGKYRILDGGFATELVKHKQAIDGDPLWSARLLHTNPEVIKLVHLSYLVAGADLIETSTYQASVSGFVKHLGIDRTAAENLICSAVDICRDVRDSFWQSLNPNSGRMKPLVLGSLGPFAAGLADRSEYHGRYVDNISLDELADWHRPQVQLLVNSGVDLLAFETVPAQKEAEAIVQLLRNEFPSSQAIISFTCKNENETCHGEHISAATMAVIDSDQVLAVGINCTKPVYIAPLLTQITSAVRDRKAIAIYPDGGEDWVYSEGAYHLPGRDASTKSVPEYVDEWLDCGATWIGGCCGVCPKDIKRIRANVKQYISRNESIAS